MDRAAWVVECQTRRVGYLFETGSAMVQLALAALGLEYASVTRREIIAECVQRGVAVNTAETQYSAWWQRGVR